MSAAPAAEKMPEFNHPYAAERHLREMQALLEGGGFEDLEQAKLRMAELAREGRLNEAADARMAGDPRWRAQELAYEAMESDSFEEAVRLVDEALELDPDCTDAQRLMVSVSATSLESRLQRIREVVAKAERNLGEAFFEEHKGHFWGTMSTRPYMRAMRELGELLAETERPAEAIQVYERMLELNENDNQGVRHPLLGLYLITGALEKFNQLVARSPQSEEFSATYAWARVLERWLSGETESAEAALTRARKVNPFAERYLSGRVPIPNEGPSYYKPGDETEAQVCAVELGPAWRRHDGARQWLRAQR